MRTIALVITLLVNILQAPVAPTPTPAFDLEAERTALWNQLTATRAAAGLPSLIRNPVLDKASQGQAEWMVANNQYTHTGEGGNTPAQRVAVAGYTTGPNYWVTEGFAVAKSPEDALAAWMSDDVHRGVVLESRLREVGIGVVRHPSGWGTLYVIDISSPVGGTVTVAPTQTPTPNATSIPDTTTPDSSGAIPMALPPVSSIPIILPPVGEESDNAMGAPASAPPVVTVLVTQLVTVVVTATPGGLCTCQLTPTAVPPASDSLGGLPAVDMQGRQPDG